MKDGRLPGQDSLAEQRIQVDLVRWAFASFSLFKEKAPKFIGAFLRLLCGINLLLPVAARQRPVMSTGSHISIIGRGKTIAFHVGRNYTTLSEHRQGNDRFLSNYYGIKKCPVPYGRTGHLAVKKLN